MHCLQRQVCFGACSNHRTSDDRSVWLCFNADLWAFFSGLFNLCNNWSKHFAFESNERVCALCLVGQFLSLITIMCTLYTVHCTMYLCLIDWIQAFRQAWVQFSHDLAADMGYSFFFFGEQMCQFQTQTFQLFLSIPHLAMVIMDQMCQKRLTAYNFLNIVYHECRN